jgi:glycosyltransferase involved in cell wall biosynthesis
MITHVFNSSIVSGPEMLVIPALKKLEGPVTLIFLTETRLLEESKLPIEYAKHFGHTVYSVPVAGRYDRKAFKQLRQVIDEINPDIVHAHDVKASLYLLGAKRSKPSFTPKIVSTHHGASYRKGKIRLYEEYYVRFVLPHFDQVLSVCELDRASIQKRGVKTEKLAVHLNGTDRARILPDARAQARTDIRKRWKDSMPSLPNPQDAFFIGAVARLSPEKRHDRMLQVLSRLKACSRKEMIPVMLFFGTGPEEAKLRELARKLRVEEFVFFMGYSKTISQEMAGFDVLLSLSDGEGIPINLIEAGWAATPVLATQVGGIPDLIPSSEFGFLVEKKTSDESIAQLLQNALQKPMLLAEVGRAYQRRVTTLFSETAWLTELKRIYSKLSCRIAC